MDTTNPTEMVDVDVALEMDSDTQTQPIVKRRRQKKSEVWDHFITEVVSPDTKKARCMHCNKSFAYINGTKASGTSHLKRHIDLGICAKSSEFKKLSPTPIKEETTPTPIKEETTSSSCLPKKRRISSPVVPPPLDQDRCNHEMAKMIIMHDYPLHMVEHPGFVGFLQALRPQFRVASFKTVHDDCVSMFFSQKLKILDFIGKIPGGVNLTVDLWSSKQSVGYAFLTGHFIDKDWNLTHRLLNVAVVASPDSDFALNQPVEACLSEWKLEGKISSIAVSQSLVNKTAVENLRGYLSARNQHVLNGQLLMGKCYARLLSSMAQDALTAEHLQEPIKKVRDSIKRVKTNQVCGDRFDDLKKQFPTPSSYKDLLIDNQTRWDTSYNMLLAAFEHKQVFSSLETCYPEYKISISPEDWRKIESLCSCLKVLFEAGKALTGPNQLTASDFYHEMTKLQLELRHTAMCEDPDVRNLANSLSEKFDQYWRGNFLVLAVAGVMDPRFKMRFIEFTFNKSYGEDAKKWTKTVNDAFYDLYLSYSEQNLLDAYVDHGFSEIEVAQESHFHQDVAEDANTGNGQSSDESSTQLEQTTEAHQHERESKVVKQNVVRLLEGVSEESQLTEEDQQHCDDSQVHAMAEEDNILFPVDVLLQEGSTLVTIGESFSDFDDMYMPEMKTELDQYLEEELTPRSEDFNVLSWWRLNTTNYPTLSKMAVDLLSVPFSTVSPDSVFETEVKQMDSYKTSLSRATLEALLCTKEWFKNETS
ncbi:PREDICTED: zinc finger BED domain-containing protein DAYSLEEPER-like [Camelina sativa]|uniref:Zinc finger BED domain-containing protein DAYSLEEPER-like n=1 Tax=Camelina sativa TaxID=90675 RepID=A0ABM0Y827_CAMSA|nr:PREDICTED: zinc finger BED domain-containing protein DAYSLEEPER-like [Camelina sativa]